MPEGAQTNVITLLQNSIAQHDMSCIENLAYTTCQRPAPRPLTYQNGTRLTRGIFQQAWPHKLLQLCSSDINGFHHPIQKLTRSFMSSLPLCAPLHQPPDTIGLFVITAIRIEHEKHPRRLSPRIPARSGPFSRRADPPTKKSRQTGRSNVPSPSSIRPWQ